MKKTKKSKLEAAGWRVGGADDFLGLSEAESRFVRLKIALSQAIKQLRKSTGLTQVEVARLLGSSQSRVAKMEAASVTG